MNCPILTSSLPASVATLESGWKQAPQGVTWAAHSQMRWGCAVLFSASFRLYQIWLLLFGCYFHMWLQCVLDSCVKFTLYLVVLILYACMIHCFNSRNFAIQCDRPFYRSSQISSLCKPYGWRGWVALLLYWWCWVSKDAVIASAPNQRLSGFSALAELRSWVK